MNDTIVLYRIVDRGKSRGPQLVACTFKRLEYSLYGLRSITQTEWRAKFNVETPLGYPKSRDWPNLATTVSQSNWRMAETPEKAWEEYLVYLGAKVARSHADFTRWKKLEVRAQQKFKKFKEKS